MLEARVFSLGIFSDNAKVDIVMTGFVAGNVLDEDDGSVNIEFLSQGNVEGLMAGSLDWCV